MTQALAKSVRYIPGTTIEYDEPELAYVGGKRVFIGELTEAEKAARERRERMDWTIEYDGLIHQEYVIRWADGTTQVPDYDAGGMWGVTGAQWKEIDRRHRLDDYAEDRKRELAEKKRERDYKDALIRISRDGMPVSNVVQYPNGKSYQPPRQQQDDREPKDYWLGERPYTAQRWLLDGILPYQGVALVSGQWGAGKTFTAMELATVLMAGGSFAAYTVPERVGVLWLAAEGAPDVPIRMAAACAKHGIDAAGQPFVWHDSVPVLTGPDAYETLIKRVRRVASAMKARGVRLGLIVVDTMATAAGWSDENDNAEAQSVMNMLRRVSDAAGLLVIAIDHFGKTTDGGTRGASSKEAAADTVLAVLGDKAPDGAVKNRRVSIRKNRYGRAGVSHAFSLPVALVIRPDSDACDETCVVSWEQATVVTAEPMKPFKPSVQAWLDVFDRNVGNDGTLTRAAWWQTGQDEGSVSDKDATFRDAIKTLLDNEAILMAGPQVYRRACDDINSLIGVVPG